MRFGVLRLSSSSAEKGVEFYRTLIRRAIHAYYAERDIFVRLDNMAEGSARWMVLGRLLEDFMKEKVERSNGWKEIEMRRALTPCIPRATVRHNKRTRDPSYEGF